MDEASLEKLGTMLIGVSVAGVALAGAGVPPGILEGGVAGAGLFLRLRGQRRSDADAVLRNLKQVIRQEWQAWGQTASFADENLRASVLASFEQVIPRCAIPAAGVVGVRLDPDQVAQLVLAQAEIALPVVYGNKDPRNTESHHARLFLLNVTRRAYAALLAEPEYIDRIAPDLWRGVLEGIDGIRDDTRRIDATTQETAEQLRQLTAMVAQIGQATAARASGVTDDALIGLARRIATDVADPAAAFRELENAVEVAIRVQAEGRQGSNLGGFVDEVLRRVAALAAQNQYDTAAQEIDAALAQEQDDSTARRIRLLDAGIAQDILRRDAESAARRLIHKADLEARGTATVATLRALQDEWMERGRDDGLNFDLAVAIALSTHTRPRANGPDDRGAILNDLGNSLWTLGQRETGTARLEQAVEAYRAALRERTQDRVPLDWAVTQMNLGTVLATLGQREVGTAGLEQAIEAFRAALTEYRQDRVPQDWARAQMNLGTALRTLGERETGTERLEQAVEAFRAALTEYRQERVPLDWARTQMNLGTAFTTLGERETGTAWLEKAVEAYRAALRERTQDRVPLQWARTQMNLGNALQMLGIRETGTARLEQAVDAYRAVLTEYRRDRAPLDWAMTQNNLGAALRTLGEREAGTARLEQAVAACRAALTELTQDRVPLGWAMAQMNLGDALTILGTREAETARLEQAVEAYRAALTEFTQDRLSLDWAMTLGNEGAALVTLAKRSGDPARARQALDQLTLAEATLRSGGHIHGAETFASQIPVAQALVDRLSGGPP
jgi:tetratricopeptide (TPR) repeat protein